MSPTRLCSLSDVKRLANVEVTYLDEDENIAQVIRAVTTHISTVVRREMDHGYRQEHMRRPRIKPNGECVLWPSVIPLDTATAKPRVYYFTGISTVARVSDSLVRVVGNKVVVGRLNDLYGVTSMRVDYYGGMKPLDDDLDQYDAPSSLRTGCAIQSAFMYQRMVNERVGVKRISSQTGSREFSIMNNGFVPEAWQMIGPYVRPLTE